MARKEFRDWVTASLLMVLVLGAIFLVYSGTLFVNNVRGGNWEADAVYLTVNTRTGAYQCFGCNGETCLNPSPIMAVSEETEDTHCANNFAVLGDVKIFLEPGYEIPDSVDPGREYEEIYSIDRIVLFREAETGELSCVGCNNLDVCKEPVVSAFPVIETKDLHCNEFFNVVGEDS